MSLKKQDLALELGMQFDEIANIFSEETLSSMTMNHVIGGDPAKNCDGGYCGNCVAGCGSKSDNCGSKIGICDNSGNDTKAYCPDTKLSNCGTVSGSASGSASGSGSGR